MSNEKSESNDNCLLTGACFKLYNYPKTENNQEFFEFVFGSAMDKSVVRVRGNTSEELIQNLTTCYLKEPTIPRCTLDAIVEYTTNYMANAIARAKTPDDMVRLRNCSLHRCISPIECHLFKLFEKEKGCWVAHLGIEGFNLFSSTAIVWWTETPLKDAVRRAVTIVSNIHEQMRLNLWCAIDAVCGHFGIVLPSIARPYTIFTTATENNVAVSPRSSILDPCVSNIAETTPTPNGPAQPKPAPVEESPAPVASPQSSPNIKIKVEDPSRYRTKPPITLLSTPLYQVLKCFHLDGTESFRISLSGQDQLSFFGDTLHDTLTSMYNHYMAAAAINENTLKWLDTQIATAADSCAAELKEHPDRAVLHSVIVGPFQIHLSNFKRINPFDKDGADNFTCQLTVDFGGNGLDISSEEFEAHLSWSESAYGAVTGTIDNIIRSFGNYKRIIYCLYSEINEIFAIGGALLPRPTHILAGRCPDNQPGIM